MATTPVQVVPAAHPPLSRSSAHAHGALPVALAPVALWHLLSLDAPTVAVCWMLLFHRGTALHRQVVPALALALAVWCIYTLDRLADARAGRELLHERHRFHWRHRRAFMVVLGPAALTLAALLPAVSPDLRSAWLLLSIPLVVYAALVHLWGIAKLPKPSITATFFAIATVLPSALHPSTFGGAPWHLLPSGVLFGGVCWLNGTFIERWEALSRAKTQSEVVLLSAAAALMAMSAGCWIIERGPVSIACGGSVLALLLLHHWRGRVSALALRSMADAALLTPVLMGMLVLLMAMAKLLIAHLRLLMALVVR